MTSHHGGLSSGPRRSAETHIHTSCLRAHKHTSCLRAHKRKSEQYPFDSVVTLALVVGVSLIVLGVIEVISGFGMRSDAKKVESFVGAGMQPHGVAH